MATTIDSKTKIHLGGAAIAIGYLMGATWWCAATSSKLDSMDGHLEKVAQSVMRQEAVINLQDRRMSVLEEIVRTLAKRMDALESRVAK